MGAGEGLAAAKGMSKNGGMPIMPFIVVKSDQCPASKPYGVFTESKQGSGEPTGSPHGCHATAAEARQQQKAMYANVPEAKPKSGREEDTGAAPGILDDSLQRRRPLGPAWKL